MIEVAIPTKEEQEIEIVKCVNLFHFLKYVKIREPGDTAVDYQLWGHLVDFYSQMLDNKMIILVKAKQIGVSWALAIYALWKIYTTPGFNVLEISMGDRESRDLLLKSRIVFDNLPKWMKRYTISPDSGEKFGFKELDSYIESYPSTEKAGMGKTAGLVIHDESDFHTLYEVNLGNSMPPIMDSPDRQLFTVSTIDQNHSDSYFMQQWRDADAGKNGFKALFYPYNVRPNRDDKFYNAIVRANENTPHIVRRNYPRSIEEALSPISATSCFNEGRLNKMWENVCEPIETRQGFICIFSEPRVGLSYGAGADVGEGVGLDYDCLTIVGKDGLHSEVAAIIYTNTLATDLFAYETDKLCREYFNCELGVENNGLGLAVINKLVELGYPNLFSSETERKRKAGRDINGTEKMGWTSSGPSKHTAMVELIETVNNGGISSKFKAQVNEMMEMQWVKNKPEPTGATHGDTVISLMLANQMMKQAGTVRNLGMYVGGQKVF